MQDFLRQHFLMFYSIHTGKNFEKVKKEYYGKEQVGNNKLYADIEWAIARAMADMGEVSDGFHTFNELYRYRMLYNAAFFLTLTRWQQEEGDQGFKLHKSKKHSDGELCFGGGWFIVMAQLPTGQISNHYPMADWDKFPIHVRGKAAKYDGHTPEEAANRIEEFLKTY